MNSHTFITRKKSNKGFRYFRNDKQITNKSEIKRLNKLAVPPAWKNVKIAVSDKAKIQAIGFDSAGRKQYIYHSSFRARQEAVKFDRILSFAQKLPKLRRKVSKDLNRRRFDKRKVSATAISLMDATYFRVGNEQYAKSHGSYGLTTLRSKHIEIRGDHVIFDFDGKSGQRQHKQVTNRSIARIIKKLDEMPGYELFRYYDDSGNLQNLKSSDINEYIKDVMGTDYSAKDFRTWGGTMLACLELSRLERPDTKSARTKAVTACVKRVARKLGNIPAITRGSYIDPRVIELFNNSNKVHEVYSTIKILKNPIISARMSIAWLKYYRNVLRRNSHTDNGILTAIIAKHQTTASQPELSRGVPTSQARIVSITCVNGWFSANARRAAGIVSVGTKALDINVSGKIITKPTHWAASRLFTINPRIADSQDIARVKITASPTTNSHSCKPAFGRNPTKNPTRIIIMPEIILRNKSAVMWPIKRALLAIGRDLKRSIMPSFISTARLIVV